MGHVDDAHHAEGDGKPDGGEQQHGTQRNAVPDILQHAPVGERRLDAGRGAARGIGDTAAALPRGGEDRQHVAAAGSGERADGGKFLVVGLVGGEDERGARNVERALHRAIGFLGERLFNRGECRGIARLQHILRGRQPPGRIRTGEFGTARRGLELAAERIVDLDLGEIGLGGLARRCAGHGIGERKCVS